MTNPPIHNMSNVLFHLPFLEIAQFSLGVNLCYSVIQCYGEACVMMLAYAILLAVLWCYPVLCPCYGVIQCYRLAHVMVLVQVMVLSVSPCYRERPCCGVILC